VRRREKTRRPVAVRKHKAESLPRRRLLLRLHQSDALAFAAASPESHSSKKPFGRASETADQSPRISRAQKRRACRDPLFAQNRDRCTGGPGLSGPCRHCPSIPRQQTRRRAGLASPPSRRAVRVVGRGTCVAGRTAGYVRGDSGDRIYGYERVSFLAASLRAVPSLVETPPSLALLRLPGDDLWPAEGRSCFWLLLLLLQQG
jgi:hypothetical protein